MWGKVRKPLQSNKLIMISRVPGYGHFEYLVLEYLCESQHVTSNKSYWVLMSTFKIGIEDAVNHSQCLTTTMIVKQNYSFDVGKNWLFAKL